MRTGSAELPCVQEACVELYEALLRGLVFSRAASTEKVLRSLLQDHTASIQGRARDVYLQGQVLKHPSFKDINEPYSLEMRIKEFLVTGIKRTR